MAWACCGLIERMTGTPFSVNVLRSPVDIPRTEGPATVKVVRPRSSISPCSNQSVFLYFAGPCFTYARSVPYTSVCFAMSTHHDQYVNTSSDPPWSKP